MSEEQRKNIPISGQMKPWTMERNLPRKKLTRKILLHKMRVAIMKFMQRVICLLIEEIDQDKTDIDT